MKTKLIITALLALCGVLTAQSLFDRQPPPEKSAAQEVADTLMETCDELLKDRINRVKNLHDTLWANERAEPEAILEALGTKAQRLLDVMAVVKSDLEALAPLADSTPAELLGDVKYLTPGKEVDVKPDGRVEVKPGTKP